MFQTWKLSRFCVDSIDYAEANLAKNENCIRLLPYISKVMKIRNHYDFRNVSQKVLVSKTKLC